MRYGMAPDPADPGGSRPPEDAAPADGRSPATGQSSPDRYRCANCEEPIATEHVLRIEAERRRLPDRPALRGTTGYMLITHLCPCSSLALTSRRYRSYDAFVAMFGRGVNLPYESPFHPAVVAEDDRTVMAWRWELEQTPDVEELLYWLEHRRPA